MDQTNRGDRKPKFEIHDISGARNHPRKTFRIESEIESEKPELRFSRKSLRDATIDLRTVRFDGRDVRWAQQHDANSCGFCVLLNLQSFVRFPVQVNNASAIASALGLSDGQRRLSTGHIGDYLQSSFGAVRVIFSLDEVPDLNRLLETGQFKAMITTSGGHYRALVPADSGRFVRLDSLEGGPRIIDLFAAKELTHNSIGLERGTGRFNQVMVIR